MGRWPTTPSACLRELELGGHRISQRIFRRGGDYRSHHLRQVDYTVLNLGIAVGGFDPR